MAEPASSARFLLLHLSLGAGAMFAASYVFAVADVWRGANLACLADATGAADPVLTLVTCTDRVSWWQGLAVLGAPVALVVATVVAAALVPAWLTRRRRIAERDLDPTVAETLRRLVADAGLSRAPLWCTAPGDPFTYGSPPRVVLGPNIYRALRRGHATAVVRHELGHVVNRDVGRTYRALLAVGLFGVAVVLPLALSRPDPGFAVRFALLTAVGALTWLAVLRTREHDADRLAATWDPAGMTAALAAARSPRGRLPWWLRTHPTPAHRLAALHTPDRVAVAESLATGIAAAVALIETAAVLATVLDGTVHGTRWLAFLLAAALLAVPITTILGTRPPRSRWACGTALAVGLLVGSQLTPRAGPWLGSVSFSGAGVEPGAALTAVPPWTALGLGVVLLLGCVGWFHRPHAVAIGPLLGVWFLLLGTAVDGSPLNPTATTVAPPPPNTRQAGYTCAWLGATGPPAFARPGLAEHLLRADDLLLREIGRAWGTETARTALVRRCGLLIRYGRQR